MILCHFRVKIFASNIPTPIADDWDDDRVRAEFDAFGTITSCKVMRDDKTGTSRGFGFVCFSSPDEAQKAIAEMNGKMIGTKPLFVTIAQRKEARRAALESQIAARNASRMQMMAAQGMGGPAGYMAQQPMYYPPPPGAFAGGARGGPMMGYPAGGMIGGRPNARFGPSGQPMGGPAGGYYGMPPAGVPYGGVNPAYRGGQPGGPRPGAGGPRGGPNGAPAGPAGMGPQARGPQGAARPQQQQQQDQAQPQKLNAATLARAAPQEQKQMLGEAIYPLIFA